jgi:uncharacterized protein (TIGR02271 family)
MRTVIGLFDDRAEAMNAYSALEANGFSQSHLDILTSDDRDDEPKLAKIRQHVPEPDSTIYLEGVRMGGTLLTAKAKEADVHRAAEIMSDYHMINIQDRAREWRATNVDLPEMTTATGTGNVLEVIEEDVDVGKETVERGRMRVYSVVSEEPVEESVALREESIRVQRRPVDRTAPADPTLFQEKSVEVVEHAEVPYVKKTARVVEEVVVGKDVNERVETVHDTVRRQDVEVEEVGTRGSGTATGSMTDRRDFASYENDFRTYYTRNWANSGMTYEQYAPGLRYGFDLAYNDAYRNRRWSDIEADARRDWEARNPGTAWDKIKAAVQHSWEKVSGQR